ncbi:YsnF/AvaK domain-containing protein [Deinococcus aestuarii]|uniref:YsnF/AvaK domain-containing protein n=1 Tax=Deinococcus aestuarii TaxID=2774531 RepID=UPI001C0E05BF|nr:YsnF/AvaK domain-containing protein [Deinococcus aestuarii]
MDEHNREGRLTDEGTQVTSSSQSTEGQATERTVTTEQVRDLRRVEGILRLHEERAVVEVVPEALAAVTIRRVLTQREEVVSIALGREHLEITVKEGQGGRVLMNGEALEVGRTYEIPVYEERAVIDRQTFPLSDVVIAKQRETYEQVERVTLRREELEVEDPQGLARDRLMPDPLDSGR